MTPSTTRVMHSIWAVAFGSAALVVAGCDRGTSERPGVAETHGATAAPSPAPTVAATDSPEARPALPTAAPPAASPPAATNLPPFEGELKLNVAGKAPEALDYAMKGDKIRLGLSATPGKNDRGIDAIIDTHERKATILLNDRKEFVEVDLDKLAKKAAARAQDVRVERTGQTAVVSGRTCDEWKIIDRDYRVSTCVVKGAPYFDLGALEQRAGFEAPGWVHSIVDAGYIPLRVIVSDAAGNKLGGTEVADTSHQVDASRFEVPNGFRKTDASKLLGPEKR